MAATVSSAQELTAPPAWRTVDFISDLHLQAGDCQTFTAWQNYMQTTPADAIFILGDLFEVWIGDDAVCKAVTAGPGLQASFENRCADVLRNAAAVKTIFFMHGNRDFLVGEQLMALCNATLLPDPLVFVFNHQRWLLSHGDALCLDDIDYMQFRQQVRTAAWQQAFLAKPLAQRQAIAGEMRAQSKARKLSGTTLVDLDAAATREWLHAADASTLIHGHTHQPAEHDLGDGLSRVVLSDWDLQARPRRAEALRMTAQGMQRICLV